MRRLELNVLTDIANQWNIEYEPFNTESQDSISTRLSRVFNASQERMFDIMADLEGHEGLFSHCKATMVVDKDKSKLGAVLEPNQFLVVSDVAEGGSRLAVSRYTLTRPTLIVEDLMTDPWPNSGVEDRKDGRISWAFESLGPDRCRMTCEGTFKIDTGKVFVRGLIDHVWLDFFENMMVELGEISRSQKLTMPPDLEPPT